jgi:hypothetical protein
VAQAASNPVTDKAPTEAITLRREIFLSVMRLGFFSFPEN